MPANVNFLKKLVRKLQDIGLESLEAKALLEKMGQRNRTLETTTEASSTCLREFYEYLNTYKISAGRLDEFLLKKLDLQPFEETEGEAFREAEKEHAQADQRLFHEARRHHRAFVRAQDFNQYNQVASAIKSSPKKPKGSFPIEVRYDYNKASDLGDTSAGSPPFETFYLSNGSFLIRTYLKIIRRAILNRKVHLKPKSF